MLFAKFFVPLNIAGSHPIPGQLGIYNVWLPAILTLIVLAIFWFFRKEKALPGIVLFFIAATLAAQLLLWEPGLLYHENYTYLAYLGIYWLTGVAFLRLCGYLKRNNYLMIIFILSVLIWVTYLGWISLQRLPDWNNSERSWTRVIELYPNDGRAYYYRGDHWAMNGEFERAKFDYNQCIRYDQNAYQAMNNLGLIYLQENDLMLALEEFTQAIAINENFYKSHLNRGLTFMRIGRNDLAMENMDVAISLNPDEPLAYYNRGSNLREKQSA